jgi:anti-sigma regulatory factor (Ser/Thr protein kinase)
VVTEFSLASQPGNERLAAERVAEAVCGLGLSGPRLERLKTAVAEATLNAMEHGHHFRPELLVVIGVTAAEGEVLVSVTDEGGPLPSGAPQKPDVHAKLAGLQSPRGWGLYLIGKMVDEAWHQVDDGRRHTIHMRMRLGGD